MLANKMKVFSERDIDIARSSISGAASYKEIAARHNLSVNRCKEIVDDVMFRVYISEGMELHNQYQGAFIVDAINRYVDRTNNRVIAPNAPNKLPERGMGNGYYHMLNNERISWQDLFLVLLYDCDKAGTWTMPAIDYAKLR